MSLLNDLDNKKNNELRLHVIRVREELQHAGLLDETVCPACKSDALVVTHVVADPKKHKTMYKLLTADTEPNDDPVAVVCADCGRVLGTVVRERSGYEKGARISGLKSFES